jgi:hypothetical protein
MLLDCSLGEEVCVDRVRKIPKVEADKKIEQKHQTQMFKIFLQQTANSQKIGYLLPLKEFSESGRSGEEDSAN